MNAVNCRNPGYTHLNAPLYLQGTLAISFFSNHSMVRDFASSLTLVGFWRVDRARHQRETARLCSVAVFGHYRRSGHRATAG